MRGALLGQASAPHLLSALDHATGAVLTQARVTDKSNEIPAIRELLEPLDPGGVVVTADAMHRQVDTAQWIRDQGGHYVLTVKGNQKTLRRTLKNLPWKKVPSVSSIDTGHGRRVRRTVKAVQAPKWVDFPAAAQVLQIRRTRTIKGRKHVEVAYPGLLTAHGTGPARAGCRLGPRALGNREPAPRRSVTSSSMRTATSCAPATAPRSWPPYAT